ncbi:MAG: hypothetical protein WEB03_16610 [Nitriliruptor sp.]|uniref:hypothetical protein n=1 Tax=Nitriliruptor sp. TaxID=2448056 RepID=UPI0034A018FC
MPTNLSKRLVLGTAAVTLLFAGSAFTASNTIEGPNVAGYGTVAVTGATVTSVGHTLSANGSQIASTKLVFSETQFGRTVDAGFDSALVNCTVTELAPTEADCSYTDVATAGAANFAVAVS